ncbi:MAG TPA: hypothetical protein VLT90_00775 [Terriglobales bacterium]|nr:hypothetical protein [Terriglobales bacterium]
MSNEHYLIASYFLVALVSLCLGVLAYRALRAPFAAIADLVAGRTGSTILKRALAASMTMAAVVGFLSVSYTQRGCMKYEQVVKSRDYLVQVNREQLQGTGNWIVYAVFAWCVVILICLLVLRKKETEHSDQAS